MSTPAWQSGQPPGWPSGPQGWPDPQPARPSRVPLIVLISLVAALIVACAVGAVLIARQRAVQAAPPPAATAAPLSPGTPTASRSTPIDPSPDPTGPTPSEPSPGQPSPRESDRPGPSSPSPLRPSPKPTPTKPAKPGPQDWLARNPLLAKRMPDVACSQRVRPLPKGRSGYEKYLDRLLACAEKSYRKPVQAAGFTLSRPDVVIYSGTVTTPCGSADPTYPAFYCSANETIYSTTQVFSGYLGTLRLGSYYLAFHEYAHHVQQRIGTLQMAYTLDQPPMQISRRIELQADCFSAIQLASTTTVTDQDWAELQEWRSYAGDEIHGRSESQLFWLRRGLDTDRFARCNTWAAKGHLR